MTTPTGRGVSPGYQASLPFLEDERETMIPSWIFSSPPGIPTPCPICFDDLARENTRLLRTECCHLFHRTCLFQSLSMLDKHCPMCRTVTEISFVTLFTEDYVEINARQTVLKVCLTALGDRVWGLCERSDRIEEKIRALKDPGELETAHQAFVQDFAQCAAHWRSGRSACDDHDLLLTRLHEVLLRGQEEGRYKDLILNHDSRRMRIEEHQKRLQEECIEILEKELPTLELRCSEFESRINAEIDSPSLPLPAESI